MACAGVEANTVSIGALKDATIFGTSGGADTGNASGMGPGLFYRRRWWPQRQALDKLVLIELILRKILLNFSWSALS